MLSVSHHREAFSQLHASGCFVIPNPWDVGTARYLRHLGFAALATSSGGFAFSRGLPDGDGAVTVQDTLAHISEIAAAADLPVNADFQSGFAEDLDLLAENVAACVNTGVSGLSIEDATEKPEAPLYEFSRAVDRVKTARKAIDSSGQQVLLTARAECYLVGHDQPLKEAVRRLTAYAEAGADVLYAPGVSDRREIETIIGALAPKPVNVLMSSHTGLRVSDLADMGVRRISVGSSLARSAWTGFIRAAKHIAEEGSFEGFDGSTPFGELNDFFRRDLASREESGQ